jgi:hypothetical protein
MNLRAFIQHLQCSVLKKLLLLLDSVSKMPLIRSIPTVKLFQHPSRHFHITDPKDLEKIFLVLTRMHFEIIEQNLGKNEFSLVAIHSPSPSDSRQHVIAFKNISLSIQGVREHNPSLTPTWQIQLFLKTTDLPSSQRTRYAELILEDLTRALGWQNYWVMDDESPSNSLAA